MNYSTDASEIYSRFSRFPGCEFMATEFAISQLIYWVRRRQPRRVLEVGAGIGTLTFTLASVRQEWAFELVSMEWDAFCLDRLQENLAEQRGDYQLIHTADEIEADQSFDMVVFDGGDQDPRPIANLSRGAVVIIEGFMGKKHDLIHAHYRGKRSYVFANFRSPSRSCGVFVFLFEPTFFERLWFFQTNAVNRAYSAAKRRGWIAESPNEFRPDSGSEPPVAQP